MAKKLKQKLVVGAWRDDVVLPEYEGSTHTCRVFVPNPKQPPETMTELNDIVSWAKKEFDGQLGSYEFIREVPGALEVFQQTVMDFVVDKEEPASE